MAAATAAAVALAWVAFASMPQLRHFAAREDGGVIPLVAVSQPFLTDVQITDFAVEAVTAAMTMDFANWREDLSEASDCTAGAAGPCQSRGQPVRGGRRAKSANFALQSTRH